MANTYLTRTTGSPTLGTKFTVSTWVKICEVPAGSGSDRWIFGEYGDSNNHSYLYLRNSSAIGWFEKDGGSTVISRITNRLCRDLSGWYHLMIAIDTTDSTAEDRFKLYINGERQTDWGTSSGTYSSSATPRLNSNNQPFSVGGTTSYGSNFVGLMSHMHFCDGTALAPTVFGSTDSTTGEWNIKTSPSFTLGNNGFTILKDGNTITDQSANSNDFSLGGGTLTKTQDNPSNNFTTLNPLFEQGGTNSNFTHGNCTGQSRSAQGGAGTSTFGVSSGKYYAEFKQSAESAANEGSIAVVDSYFISNNQGLGGSSSPGYFEYSVGCFGLRNSSTPVTYYSSSGAKATSSNTHAGWSNDDIISIALDMDNKRVYFAKNGQWNASNTWSSATPSQYTTIDSTNFTGTMHFGVGDSSGGNHVTWQCNFGNGYFGTTAVATEGTNASGNGIFEFDVPTGYTALSTKGLNL
jgi:hypothetical protein